ncbi:P-loop containing nucleoside triphosphate hydrolase protein [Stachybotrys elegans]|uniref:P-loop containing nucleoside triphosphate hydrolase protein n=1 Tax=Stachybotrys elegans TaxID=80388 RepID=A0A8K0SUK0_9HYPO|nr:P-loop containing nucleoside triphosphate hydrolase protein [Stachybotrys elegans]
MTKVMDPFVSDDEFDIVDVNRADTVSDLASPGPSPVAPLNAAASHQLHDEGQQQFQNQPAQAPGPTRAAPSHSFDRDMNGLAQAMSGIPLDDSYASQATSYDAPTGVKRGKSMIDRALSLMDWSTKDVLIAVMGMTGSGKTTFISKVTGRTDLKIGHDLTSCTRDIEVIETQIEGRTVRFVDTPGFSDTNLSDTEVLQLIADYLATAYMNDRKLSGIIYLHPISDTRVTHHATKNLDMFRKLTGDNNLKNVLLTTSMWDKVTSEEGDRREAELKSKFWKLLTSFGAKVARYRGTTESAEELASMLLDSKPFYLQLQEEMGKNNKPLRETAAGRELMIEIARMKEEHQREIADIKNMMRQVSAEENRTLVEALKEHYQSKLDELESSLRDERKMNESTIQGLQGRIEQLERKGSCTVM